MNDWVENWKENENVMEEALEKKKRFKGFLFSRDLREMGLKCGEDVMIHERCLILYPHNIEIGSNVRIDADTKLCPGSNGYIKIGSHVHISFNVALMGSSGIRLDDYTNIAMNSALLSVSDDFRGLSLIGPQVPIHTRKLHKGEVRMRKYSVVGINSTMMPGSILDEGAALHGYSLLMGYGEQYTELMGVPAKVFKQRSREFLKFVEDK